MQRGCGRERQGRRRPRSIRRAPSAKPSAPRPLLPTPPSPRVLRRPLQWSQRRPRHRNPPFSSRTPLSRRKAPQLPASRTARPARPTPPQPQHRCRHRRSLRHTADGSRGQAEGRERHGGGREGRHVRQSRHANGRPRQRAFGRPPMPARRRSILPATACRPPARSRRSSRPLRPHAHRRPAHRHRSDASAAVPLSGLAMEIAASAKSGKSRFEIRLDPAELGRIDVRIDVDRNGQVTSHLTVDRPETLSMLRQDANQLQRALDNAGLSTGNGGLAVQPARPVLAGPERRQPVQSQRPSPDRQRRRHRSRRRSRAAAMAACSVRAAASISGFNGDRHGSRCNHADDGRLGARDRHELDRATTPPRRRRRGSRTISRPS